MSAFECNLTPTRVRNQKKRNEDREPTFVDLRPFTAKAIVTFEDVPVSKLARRLIIVSNPYDDLLKVTVTRALKPDLNALIEWNTNRIQPQSQINLEVLWTPLKAMSCREILQISDEHGNKKDIAIIFKSCELKKTNARKVAPQSFHKKLKIKSPSPPRFNARPRMTMENQENLQIIVSPLRNATNIRQIDIFEQITYSSYTLKKENEILGTPKNACDLFDNIRFTPLTETRPKTESKLEYLSNLPTPIGTKRADIIISDVANLRTLVDFRVTPGKSLRSLSERELSLGERDVRKAISFEKSSDEIDEIELLISNRTHVLPAPTICVIEEKVMQKTFEVEKSKSLSEMENASAQEVPGKIQLQVNQGSMPNLFQDNDANSIENNRYFRGNLSIESTVSHTDFQETEMCAQSSRLFLCDFPVSPSKPCEIISEDKLSIHLSPTMQRIQLEPELKSTSKKENIQMTFSPPRRNLASDVREMQRRETFAIPAGGRVIRATTWKHQQGKECYKPNPFTTGRQSLKLTSTQSLNSLLSSSLNSISSTISTPATLTRGRLYNENHINAYNNNDPFSATTTNDPFLSSTMFLDEQMLDGIEKTYIKWLNALVTIPPDLESDINEKIDIGKLFNDVQSKELTLAPTKEVVCSRYYTSRLDTLRAAAVRFFHTQEISTPLNKITVVMNEKNNRLDIKADRHIHLDLVLQRNLLELLLCYNPLWLRIGLEVIFNVQLNLTSNHDIYGMTRFIITSMFKSPYLAEKYSKFSQQKEYLDKLRKFSVKNFLFVVFFLDRAKEARLIKQNPCLFVKRAPYKESNEILKKFASLVLANYGDIIRMLRRFEYTLTHKQTVIDEFDFAFKNLAVDLRDGVRLTKVMEIILMRDDLVQRVRVPAISRLQKVHNVELALKALEAADYQILGDIISKDIADGHREKTLSLLWQIIYKFRAPRFNAAAKTIQKFWRSKMLMVVINKRIRIKEEERLARAATVIQMHIRAFQARKRFKARQKLITKAVVTIQRFFRGFIARKFVEKQLKSIVAIQRWIRRVKVVKEVRTEFLQIRITTVVIQRWWRREILARKLVATSEVIREANNEAQIRNTSACVIQRSIKSFVIHQKLHTIVHGIVSFNRKVQRKNKAASKIQSILKMQKARREFVQVKSATVTIQRWWRFKSEGKKVRCEFLMRKEMTVKIQRWFRGVLVMCEVRKQFEMTREVIVKVQRRFRGVLAMKQEVKNFRELKKAALIVQRRFRDLKEMKSDKKKFEELKKSAVNVQQRFRAMQAMKVEQKRFLSVKAAAVVIQKKIRATIQMEIQQKKYLKIKTAAIVLQRRFRAQKLMEIERKSFKALQTSAISIQRRFRAQQSMQLHRKNFLELQSAALIIQRRFRANQAMKSQRNHFMKLKQLTIHLQQKFRSTRQMRELTVKFYSLQYYAVALQQRFRANIAMKKARNEFLQLKAATIFIKRKYRGKIEVRKEIEKLEKVKSSVRVIQKFWRATRITKIVREEFLVIQKTTITVQRRFRANQDCKKQRGKFLEMKKAVTVISERFQAQNEMKKARENYRNIQNSILVIQRKFQATMKMKIEVQKFQELKSSAIVIQRSFRGYQEMKIERENFQSLKESVVIVQRRFRAQMLMKVQQSEYKKLQSAAIIIQTRFRAQKAMKIQVELVSAVVAVQRRFRALQQMQVDRENFKIKKLSAIAIQRKYRATLAMRKEKVYFEVLRSVSVNIQQRFRVNLETKKQRKNFLELKNSTIVIQRSFRAFQESIAVKKAAAAMKIIQFYREFKLTQEKREEFLKLRSATISIQRNFRTLQQRQKFLTQKTSAVKIQKFFRGFLKMKKQRREFLELKSAALKVQQKFRAQKIREIFIQKREAAVKVQRRWREKLLTRKTQEQFKITLNAIVTIQRRFHAQKLMQVQRESFKAQKIAATKIQRCFRGHRQTLIARSQFLQLKKTVLTIENRILGNKMMSMQREEFLSLRHATVFIQRRFRSKIETIQTHKQFNATRVMVLQLQKFARGFQARQRFKILQTPEKVELRQKHKAARMIQAAYRGHRERSKASNRCFKEIVERLIRAKKNVDPAQTLGAKLKTSIDFIRNSYDANIAITFLAKLEYIARTVPWILIEDAEFVSLFCYGLMAHAIRSEVDKQIIELCSCIILNLSRYKDTKEDAFQEFGLKTIAQMLLRWCDKDCGIFNTLCTLVWVFAHCEKKKNIIREFIMMKDGEFIIAQIKQNVLRKENMRKNSRRPIGFQSISLVKYKKDYQMQLRFQPQSTVYSSGFITPEMLRQCKEMPSMQPDYGVVKTMPYIFYSSVFAFDRILKSLNIGTV